MLVAALAALFSVVSTGASPAAAQPAVQTDAPTGSIALAGVPHVDAEGGGRVVNEDFFFSDPNAGAKARAWVHSSSSCGNSFCTIQSTTVIGTGPTS